MAKMLQVNMPDGSQWQVPAQKIAEDRAAWYARRYADLHAGAGYDYRYGVELEQGLADDDALIDWAENNMDWDDLDAVQTLSATPPDYGDLWVNAEKEMIDVASVE